jgi:hypothetical protein
VRVSVFGVSACAAVDIACAVVDLETLAAWDWTGGEGPRPHVDALKASRTIAEKMTGSG